MSVKISSATTTVGMTPNQLIDRIPAGMEMAFWKQVLLTAEEPLSILPGCHLCETLTVCNDAECDVEEKLEALQKVCNDTSPVSEEAESKISLHGGKRDQQETQ